MSNFIEVTFNQSEEQLAEEAIQKLVELMEAKGFIGWQPSEGDLEIILIAVLAGLAATLNQIASVVPNAIFREFGTQLLKVPFNEGAAATGKTKWTIAPSESPRTIEGGTTIEAGGLGFVVVTSTEVPAKASTLEIEVVAVERGILYNGVTGEAFQVNPIDYVLAVAFIGETSGGKEEESDAEYLVRLATALTLQAPRPITAENYATFVVEAANTAGILPAGQEVGRATSIDGYNPATNEAEGKVVSGSVLMKEVTSYTGITVGSEIQGAGVPKGTIVSKLSEGEKAAKELTMSAKATESPAKSKYKFIGSFEQERYVTTFVTKPNGLAMSNEAMTAIETWLKTYREINFKTPVRGPEVNKVYIKTKIHILPGYIESTVKSNVETEVKKFLSPETWGSAFGANTGAVQEWINYVVKAGIGEHLFGTIRYNQILGVIEKVPGVAYVLAGATGLEIGLEEGAKGTADLAMVGAAPLPALEKLTIEFG